MAKAEKANEPTMDEILASIRKIIAEEPVSNQAGNSAARNAEVGADPKGPSPRASLDDILGMADAPSREPIAARQSDAAGTADRLPSSAAPAGASSKAEANKPGAGSPRPFFPASTGSKFAENAEPDRASGAASEARAESSRAVDFGAIVPSKAAGQTVQADDVDRDRRPLSGRLPEWLGRSAGSTASGGASVPKPAAPATPGTNAESESLAKQPRGREAEPQGPSFPVPPVASTAGRQAPASRSGTADARPSASPAANTATPPGGAAGDAKVTSPASKAGAGASGGSGLGHAPETKPAPETSGVRSVPASAPGNQAKSAPIAKTVPTAAGTAGPRTTAGPPANGLDGALAKPAAPEASVPAATARSSTVPVPVAETPSPMARPAVLDKSKAVKPAPTGDLVANALPIGGVRTLDDTIVELLRPMIRQWLDDNMPRMVEKALRIEMAASLQVKGAAIKSDSSKH